MKSSAVSLFISESFRTRQLDPRGVRLLDEQRLHDGSSGLRVGLFRIELLQHTTRVADESQVSDNCPTQLGVER